MRSRRNTTQRHQTKLKETQNRVAEKKAETQATQTATTVHRKVAATVG